MATTVSFINFKGGVGKTTLCVEVGAALASKFGERVLLVDLDPQTNATLFLMSEEEWTNHTQRNGSLFDFFKAKIDGKAFDMAAIRVKEPMRPRGVSASLDLLPSHVQLFGIDLKLATRFGHGDLKPKLLLREALQTFSSEYDYVLIDCPPNLYLATQNGLFASDYYVIVALAEYLSTVGIGYIQKAIREIFDDARETAAMIGGSGIEEPRLLGIIFNRLRTKHHGTKYEETIISMISTQYPDKVFGARVPLSTKIAEKPMLKVPIAISGYAEDRDYEERIREVAEEFYERVTRP